MSAHETRRLVSNFAFLTIGYFFVRLITMAATLYVARTLGPDGFGSLSSGVNVALALAAVANLGLAEYLVLTIARKPQISNELLGNAFLVKLIVPPFALLGAWLFRFFDPQFGLLFFIMILHGLFHSYLLLLWAAFRGLERMQFQTFLMLIQAVIIAVGSSAAVWLTRSATIAAAAYLLSSILTVAVGYALLSRQGIRPTYRWRPDAWKQLLQTALPFGLIYVYLVIYDKLPTILLPLLSSREDAGWFNSVYTIALVLATIPSISMAVVFPFVARKSQQDRQAVAEISTSLIKYTTIISLGLTILFVMLAPWLIPLLFGEAYLPAVGIMQIVAISFPFLFLIITLVNMIEAVGQQRICARYAGYALLPAIPICIFFIWQWGYWGGAIAYALNNAFLALLMLWLVRRTIGHVPLSRAFWLPMCVGLIAGFFIYFLRHWSIYALLPSVTALYLTLLLLSGVIGLPEVELARKIWHSRSLPPLR